MSGIDRGLSGGCQCGAVRFHAGRIRKSTLCHCRMCQKAFGSYFGPLVMADEVTWTRGEPKFFRSSNLARRGFCAQCGTPLCYLEDEGGVELAGGAFDDPAAVAPALQINVASRLSFYDGLASVPHHTRVDLETQSTPPWSATSIPTTTPSIGHHARERHDERR